MMNFKPESFLLACYFSIITISDSIVGKKSISQTFRVMGTGRHEDNLKCFDGKRCLKHCNLLGAQILQYFLSDFTICPGLL